MNKTIAALEDGLSGWNNTLLKYDETNEQFKDGRDLKDHVPKKWFDSFVREKDNDLGVPMPTDHLTSLLPDRLINSAKPLATKILEENGKSTDLTDTNRIVFSGGGNVLEYNLNHHQMKEVVKNLGVNMNYEGKIGAKIEGQIFAFLPYTKTDSELYLTSQGEFENKETSTTEQETSISFALGDADWDDEFAVDIYTDPRYGTFLFVTVEGSRSICPNEAGTVQYVVPDIKLWRKAPKVVLPDEPMIFLLKLSNLGSIAYWFELLTDHRENIGLLSHLIDGDTIIAPITYDTIDAGESVFSTLTIERGPEKYDYPGKLLTSPVYVFL